MGRRLRIGSQEASPAGKAPLPNRFIELGVPVIDADEAARAVVAPGKRGLPK